MAKRSSGFAELPDELRDEDMEAGVEDTAGMAEEEVPVEEGGAEFPPELVEETVPAGGAMVHTSEEIPQLADLDVGDEITFRIANVSEDGAYELMPVTGEITEPAPEGMGEGLAGAM